MFFIRQLDLLRTMFLAVRKVGVQKVFSDKAVEAVVTVVCLSVVLRLVRKEAAEILDQTIMSVSSFGNEKKIHMAFEVLFSDVERKKFIFLVVDDIDGDLVFSLEFRHLIDCHWKGNPIHVQFLFIGLIVGNPVRMQYMIYRMESGKDRIKETMVFTVLYINDGFGVLQFLGSW